MAIGWTAAWSGQGRTRSGAVESVREPDPERGLNLYMCVPTGIARDSAAPGRGAGIGGRFGAADHRRGGAASSDVRLGAGVGFVGRRVSGTVRERGQELERPLRQGQPLFTSAVKPSGAVGGAGERDAVPGAVSAPVAALGLQERNLGACRPHPPADLEDPAARRPLHRMQRTRQSQRAMPSRATHGPPTAQARLPDQRTPALA